MVDRKDLDYQTMKEYDRFEKGAANSNTSTTILKRQDVYKRQAYLFDGGSWRNEHWRNFFEGE